MSESAEFPGTVFVVGSAVADTVYRLSTLPLAGESQIASEVTYGLGGKGANQAVAARRLGAEVIFLGRVGDDDAGRATEADLRESGLGARLLVTPDAPTGHAAVLLDEAGENQIAVYLGANLLLSADDVEAERQSIQAAAVVVTQLEVPFETVRRVADVARRAGRLAVLNAAPFVEGSVEILSAFDVVVMNHGEAELAMGVGIAHLDDALAALRGLRDAGVADPVITLGAAGAVYYDRGRTAHAPAPEVEAVDATGAGDAFVGALAAFLAEGRPVEEAVPAACHYATLSVTQPGTRASFLDRARFEASFAAEHGSD